MGTTILINPDIDIPVENIKLSSVQEKFYSSIVTAKEFIEIPPICFEIKDGDFCSEIGTLGNISLWIGKAKQGKTFAISMSLAAAETGEWLMDKIKVTLPEANKNVLLFDTEQSKHHVQRVVRRICKMANREEPVNLLTSYLRKYPPAERLEIIEWAIYNTDSLGFVVIDGIRDLVTSINDEEQCTMISSKLLKWSEELNIHIAVVLHTNKGDNNARGHLGTELTNKSESVISISKDEENKDQMLVKPEYCRSKEFSPFAFKIDEWGVPYISELPVLSTPTGRKSVIPVDIPPETHLLVLEAVFRRGKELKYADLIFQIKDYFMRLSIKFGDNKAKEFATFYQNDSYIESFKPDKGNTLYRQVPKVVAKKLINTGQLSISDENEECPF